MRELNSKTKKNVLENYILGAVRRCNKSEKLRHTKFKFPTTLWRRVMRGTNSKHKKTSPKNCIYRLKEDTNIYGSYQVYVPNFNCLV